MEDGSWRVEVGGGGEEGGEGGAGEGGGAGGKVRGEIVKLFFVPVT